MRVCGVRDVKDGIIVRIEVVFFQIPPFNVHEWQLDFPYQSTGGKATKGCGLTRKRGGCQQTSRTHETRGKEEGKERMSRVGGERLPMSHEKGAPARPIRPTDKVPKKKKEEEEGAQRPNNPSPPVSAGSGPHFSISILTFCFAPRSQPASGTDRLRWWPCKNKIPRKGWETRFLFPHFFGLLWANWLALAPALNFPRSEAIWENKRPFHVSNIS